MAVVPGARFRILVALMACVALLAVATVTQVHVHERTSDSCAVCQSGTLPVTAPPNLVVTAPTVVAARANLSERVCVPSEPALGSSQSRAPPA